MKNSWKVAKWELKRNIKNKSFIISLFLTPILFLVFSTLPTLLDKLQSDPEPVTVYVKDELHVWNKLEPVIKAQGLQWKIEEPLENEDKMMKEIEKSTNTAYIPLTEDVLSEGKIKVYMSEDVDNQFLQQASTLEQPLYQLQLSSLELTTEQMEFISKGVAVEAVTLSPKDKGEKGEEEDALMRAVPGIFAGVILFSIVITGMMIFQSASQEKKEKVAEIILSSVTPGELMNGKIMGYFGLGIIQVIVWMLFIIPIVIWRIDFPVMEYLLVPETLLLVFIAFAGYLLFAAFFVGMGATVEDMSSAGNFQGMVMMLPFLPFVLIGPVLSEPEGIIAQIGSYFPISAPAILLVRLSVMQEWPWMQILISIVILLVSIWILMVLAGKIFKTGILMYGKNATPKEILKWLKH